MSVEANLQTLSASATADLSAKQFYAVIFDTSGGMSLATAAKNCDGFLQDKPVAAQAGEMAYMGVTKAAITASTTITKGQLLEVDTGGTLKGVASGTVVAKALEALSSVASVQLITVLILKSNAVYS